MFLINAGRAIVAAPGATLNPSDKDPNIVLSNGNLTANDLANAAACVRSTTSHSSGKVYYTWTMTTSLFSYGVGAGIANSSASLAAGPGSPDINSAAYYVGDPNVYAGGVSVGNTGVTPVQGDTAGLALDVVGQLIWVMLNSGNWNGNPSANPVTGVGGFSVSSFAGPYFAILALGANTSQATVNFTTGTPPSGYTQW